MWDKSCGRGQKRCQFLLYRLFLLLELFFRQHFPICWLIGTSIPLVGCVIVLCTCTHMCRRKKKPAERNVLVENDTWTRKQKANEKNNQCRSSKKNVVEADSESSRNIDPGEMLQAGLRDGRRSRCPLSLGNGQRPLPKENTWSRSSRRRLLCSYLHASTPTISTGTQPKVFSEKKASRLPPIRSFSSTTMTGTDGSRP